VFLSDGKGTAMSEQIILKLGGRPMNEAALVAGFEFAKGSKIPILAYFMEDEALFQASRFSFSKEVQVCGAKRGLEVHELRRESKITMRALSREVKQRSKAAQIESQFVMLNGNGPDVLQAQVEQPNVMVLGEHQSARQMAKECKKFSNQGGLQGILMAGPRAGYHLNGPLAVVVHELSAWEAGLPLLRGYLASSTDLLIYCVGDVINDQDKIRGSLDDDYAGDVMISPLRRCDQSRLIWMMERAQPGLFFALPGAPYLVTEKDIEAMIRLLPCPLFVSLSPR